MGKNHITIESNLKEGASIEGFKWNYSIQSNKIVVETNNPDVDIVSIIDFMNNKSIPIYKIKTERSTLEEIFIKLTNDNE